MDKQKIEEMASVLTGRLVDCNSIYADYIYLGYVASKEIATYLVDADYRKAEEVKKETARKILKMLHEIGGCGATEEWDKGYDSAIDNAYETISKEYGVEMEDE